MIPAPVNLVDLQFWQRDNARLASLVLVAVLAVLLALRSLRTRQSAREGIVLPGLLRSTRPLLSMAWLRHAPLVPLVAGIPFLLLALADPYSALVSSDVSFPGSAS